MCLFICIYNVCKIIDSHRYWVYVFISWIKFFTMKFDCFMEHNKKIYHILKFVNIFYSFNLFKVWLITKAESIVKQKCIYDFLINKSILLWRLRYEIPSKQVHRNLINSGMPSNSATKSSLLLLPPLIHPEPTSIKSNSDCLGNCCLVPRWYWRFLELGVVGAQRQNYKITLFVWLLLVRQSPQQYYEYFGHHYILSL